MDPGLFTEQGWKAVASKHKIKDNGLLKALIDYQKLAEDQYDGRLAAAALVSKLAGALRKDKQVAANTSVVKYLADLVDFADAVRGEIIKGKAAAEKSAAQAKQRQHSPHADEQNEEEDEETGDVIVRLKRALQSLKNSKEPFYFLACDAKPYGLVVSRKNIKSSAQHRKELVTLAGGSTRPPKFGTCRRDGNNLLFDMETPAPGLARILQKWIKINTGLPLKITVGDESADDEDGITQGEGQQIELPPVPPALEKAPELWLQTRQEIEASIDGLKDAIRKQFAEEGPAPIAEMEENVKSSTGYSTRLMTSWQTLW